MIIKTAIGSVTTKLHPVDSLEHLTEGQYRVWDENENPGLMIIQNGEVQVIWSNDIKLQPALCGNVKDGYYGVRNYLQLTEYKKLPPNAIENTVKNRNSLKDGYYIIVFPFNIKIFALHAYGKFIIDRADSLNIDIALYFFEVKGEKIRQLIDEVTA